MTKMTITEQINAIAFETLTEEQFNFLVERALKSVRKSNGERKPTKVQKENEGIKAQMREVLADSEGMTATAVGKAVDISVQKASALLGQMVKAGEVVKAKDGKATIFTVA
jgi:predicted transcriptional regulator